MKFYYNKKYLIQVIFSFPSRFGKIILKIGTNQITDYFGVVAVFIKIGMLRNL